MGGSVEIRQADGVADFNHRLLNRVPICFAAYFAVMPVRSQSLREDCKQFMCVFTNEVERLARVECAAVVRGLLITYAEIYTARGNG